MYPPTLSEFYETNTTCPYATGTGQNPRIKVGKGDELPLEEQKEEEGDDNSP